MFEDVPFLRKLYSFILGAILILFIILMGAKGFSPSNDQSASGNPNVIAGTFIGSVDFISNAFDNIGNNFRQLVHRSGHAAKVTPKPVARVAVQQPHTSAKAGAHRLDFFGDIFSHAVGFIDRTLVTGIMYVANAASSCFSFVTEIATITPITEPSMSAKVPSIKPLEAKDVAYQAIVQQVKNPPVVAPAPPAPAPVQPAPVQQVPGTVTTNVATIKASDMYAWGNCTWWVFIRRAEIGHPIPNSWGNATSWSYFARRDGYVVDHTPAPGAIMQISGVYYGLGHVAFVEGVDPDGTWHISEMNVIGLDAVDHKAEPPAAAANYDFIH